MLNHAEVISYLLENEWLSPEAVVQDHLEIVNLSRRNRNFKVVGRHNPGYFLKQGNGEVGPGTVAHEATVYQWLQQHSTGLSDYLANYLGYDPTRQILTVEFIRDGQDLGTYQVRRGKFPRQLAVQIGQALGLLHSHAITPLHQSQAESSPPFLDLTPWVFNAHRPEFSILHSISEADLKLMQIIQKFSEFGDRFKSFRQDWQSQALIHGDIKLDNLIAYFPDSTRRKSQIKLIDWEFAGMGDPCWDVGSVFSTYLSLWIGSIPITGEVPPAQFASLAALPLQRMQAAIAAFWQAYCQQMALDSASCERWLLRSVQLAAARLVQTGLESTGAAGRLTSTVICLLQLSLNILQHPKPAAAHLLGISGGRS